MTTIGKVCLWLSVTGLAVISVWLLPAVGKRHNEISANLLASETALNSAMESHRKQKRQLDQRKHELARLQIGWDKSWNIQPIPGNNEIGVRVDGARLTVGGLGSEAGLKPVLDDAGQPVQPIVHAFATRPEGGMLYFGEFQAEQLNPMSCTLVPTWQVTQDDVVEWTDHLDSPWRFRTMVPAANRLEIDQRRGQLQKLFELYSEAEANVVQQEASLRQAESELLVRKEELLGNPDAQEIPGRPEFRDGLLKTISAEEDFRNDLLIQVDTLRRKVREASQERQELLDRLKEITEQLDAAEGDQITQADSGVR